MGKSMFHLFLGAIIYVMTLAGAVQPTFSWAQAANEKIPVSYFGLHIHRIVLPQPYYPKSNNITPWPPIKFGSWRLWDARVDWPYLEPERGKWNFQTLDKYVALAEREGIDLVLPFGLSPPWASARPTEPSSYGPGNAAEPRDIEDWRNYVSTVARRYKGRIKYYELWNEVNLKGFYSGSKEKLVELARVAYQTLKEVDPDIVFVSPSATGGGHRWLDDYLAKGGAKYLDIVGYHFYIPKAAPEAMLPIIQQVQSIMRKHGLEKKPLWNTEIGWWIENKTKLAKPIGARPDWRKLDDEQAAAYVARTMALSWPAGISRVFWYVWDGIDMGLIEPGSLELKPAAIAFDTMAHLLTGGQLKQCSKNDRIWICSLVRADGKSVRIVWAEDDLPRKWPIPVDWRIKHVQRLDGSSSELNGDSIQIGMAPVFLIAEGDAAK